MKQLMDNVLASIASGVITTGSDNLVITYNQAAERILGIPYAQAIDEPFKRFFLACSRIRRLDRVCPAGRSPASDRDRTCVAGARRSELEPEADPAQRRARITYGMALVVDDLTEIKKRDATSTWCGPTFRPALCTTSRASTAWA